LIASTATVATPWQVLRRDFATSLDAERKSPNTLRLYLGAVDKLAGWVTEQGGPDDPRELTRTDLALFFAAMGKEWKPSTCSLTFRALQQFFSWLVREEEIDRSPMEWMRPPQVTVIGKGSRVRIVPFGLKAAQALGRYLRLRDRDRWADLPAMWLAEKGRGPLGADGIRQMLERRGKEMGIPGLHAHQFVTRRPIAGRRAAATRPTSCG
jgi:site-specific recombinase XerC